MHIQGKKRIVVAMSGGVDSSTVAALLHQQGHEVIGITLRLWTPSPWNNGDRYGSCCSPQDVSDAKKVCQQLGIPHYTFDMEQQFKTKVVDNFISEYLEGKTPNPCVRCNSFIKFDPLLKYAVALNAEYLATGHYAQIRKTDLADHSSTDQLCKAVDFTKDQSYFLYMLNQKQLAQLLFPLGEYTKVQVRAFAEEFQLVNAKKQDSQDVCFLEGRNYREFITERVQPEQITKGPIQNTEGKVLGEHQGLAFYTIGQREKLGIAAGYPLYVVAKDTKTNTLVVGAENENLNSTCELESANWCAGSPPSESIHASVKIRYRHAGSDATLLFTSDTEAKIQFDQPQSSITPGQSAVFYNGDIVLGGGIIRKNS